MKIAVISDIHENFHNLIVALEEIKKRKVKQIIFLGDFINNGIAKVLAESVVPVFAIWGNNDGDKPAITKTALSNRSNLTVSDSVYDFLEFDGRKIFITHSADLAKPMARSGIYDAVFYGHNHIKHEDKIGSCLIANPGEISAHKTGSATFAVYDTKKNNVEFVTLKKSITLKTKAVDKYFERSRFVFSHPSKRRAY
jgi:hypothetical protein